MRYRGFHTEQSLWDRALEAVLLVLVIILTGPVWVAMTDDPCDDWSDRPLGELKEKAKGGAQC